jgi:hypothetical protein
MLLFFLRLRFNGDDELAKHHLVCVVSSIVIGNEHPDKVLRRYFPPILAQNEAMFKDTLNACEAFLESMDL